VVLSASAGGGKGGGDETLTTGETRPCCALEQDARASIEYVRAAATTAIATTVATADSAANPAAECGAMRRLSRVSRGASSAVRWLVPVFVCVVAVALQIVAAWRMGALEQAVLIDRHAWGGFTSTPPQPSTASADALDAMLGPRARLLQPWAKARALHAHGDNASGAAAAVLHAIASAVDVEAAFAAGLITSRPGNPRKFRRLPVTPRRGSQDVGHVIADGGNLDGFYPDTYAKIVELSGGADKAVICVAPMASCSLMEATEAEFNPAQTWFNKWEEAAAAFGGAGIPASRLLLVPLTVDNADEKRDDANIAGLIRRCTGIWFPGGAPYRITRVLYAAKGTGGKEGVTGGTGMKEGVTRSSVGGDRRGRTSGNSNRAGEGTSPGNPSLGSPGPLPGASSPGMGDARGTGIGTGIERGRGKGAAVLAAIVGRHVAGASVSGTSAGAMAFSAAPMVLGGRNYVALRDPAGPVVPPGLNTSSGQPQLTFDPSGGALPLVHGKMWAGAMVDAHASEYGYILRLARLAWHTRHLPNGTPYAFGIGEGTQLVVSGNGRLAHSARCENDGNGGGAAGSASGPQSGSKAGDPSSGVSGVGAGGSGGGAGAGSGSRLGAWAARVCWAGAKAARTLWGGNAKGGGWGSNAAGCGRGGAGFMGVGAVGAAQWAIVRGPGTVHLLDLTGAYEVRTNAITDAPPTPFMHDGVNVTYDDGFGLFGLANITLHQLTSGDRIDLNTGEVTVAPWKYELRQNYFTEDQLKLAGLTGGWLYDFGGYKNGGGGCPSRARRKGGGSEHLD